LYLTAYLPARGGAEGGRERRGRVRSLGRVNQVFAGPRGEQRPKQSLARARARARARERERETGRAKNESTFLQNASPPFSRPRCPRVPFDPAKSERAGSLIAVSRARLEFREQSGSAYPVGAQLGELEPFSLSRGFLERLEA